MAVKKRKSRRFLLFKDADQRTPETESKREDENYSLDAILAEFRANRDAEREADGVAPVTDEDDAELERLFAPETDEDRSEDAGTYRRYVTADADDVRDSLFNDDATEAVEAHGLFDEDAESVETHGLFDEDAESVETHGLFDEDAESVETHSLFDDDATESGEAHSLFDDDATESGETYRLFDDETYRPFDDATEPVETRSLFGEDAERVETYNLFDDAPEAVTETPVTETVKETAEAETVADATEAEVVEAETVDAGTEAEASQDAEPSAETFELPDMDMEEEPEPPVRQGFWRRLFRRDKPSVKADAEEPETDAPPRSIPLGEVVGHTVDAVKADELLEKQRWPRRSLFSRRRMEEAEEGLSEESAGPEMVGPEPSLKNASDQSRREYVKRIEGLIPATVPAVLPLLTLILEAVGLRLPLLTGSVILRPLLLLGCLCGTLWFCRGVFKEYRCTAAFLCGVSAVAACLDCLTAPFLPGRSMAEPYGAVACLALLIAKVGASMESHGNYSAFRVASMDRNPPYLVTDTVRGACKQRGAVTGFYTAMQSQNFSTRWQTLFLPVTLAASLVFAALSSVGQERGGDFFLNWSAILTAGATLALPLCWGLPWAQLSARLKKAGCAIAGWRGAEQIARKKKMIVTDTDLFPPGSVQLEDVRVYGIERKDAASLVASMIRDSGCGLERIFDDFLTSESGEYVPIRDFQFYEDGGFSGVVDDNVILVGTSSFLRKMSVRFPGDFYFPMGIYLAVDGALAATFALKYEAVENVDYALRMMRRNRVTAILAARDPNLTPKLLQRVFHRRVDVEYPGLNNRLSLSVMQSDRDMPRGLLFREGLPPYAELVVGSMRLCGGVRWSTRLALFSSAVGTLLSFYLVFQAKYYLLTPLNLLLFLLLWTAPVVLLMDLS